MTTNFVDDRNEAAVKYDAAIAAYEKALVASEQIGRASGHEKGFAARVAALGVRNAGRAVVKMRIPTLPDQVHSCPYCGQPAAVNPAWITGDDGDDVQYCDCGRSYLIDAEFVKQPDLIAELASAEGRPDGWRNRALAAEQALEAIKGGELAAALAEARQRAIQAEQALAEQEAELRIYRGAVIEPRFEILAVSKMLSNSPARERAYYAISFLNMDAEFAAIPSRIKDHIFALFEHEVGLALARAETAEAAKEGK